MHDAVEVGEEVEGRAEVFSEERAFGDGVGEYRPEVGDEEAAGDGGEAVGGEDVGRVGGLAVAEMVC